MTTAQLIVFESLEDFIRRQNNFYGHFNDKSFMGELRRKREYFLRFKNKNLDFELSLTRRVTDLIGNYANDGTLHSKLPWSDLYQGYKLISLDVLVSEIINDGLVDDYYLCR